MSAGPILGQGEEFDRLVRHARARRMHHGVLISGARGIGKSRVAQHLARSLLCSGDDADGPCGVCPDCRQGLAHADLHTVTLPEDKDEIPVDLVRDLKASLARLPVMGRARVVILDPADRLNVQGQNALLKTLEEPGHDTYLLLTTRRPEGMLETVRSRVASLRVLPLSDETLRGEFSTVDGAVLDQCIPLAGGSLGQARMLLDEENRPILGLLETFLAGADGSPVSAAKAALEGASGRMESLSRARLVLWMLRTLLRKELRNGLAMDDTAPYLGGTSVRWTAALEKLIDAERDLNLRIPPEQVLVDAMFHIFPQAD